MSIAQGLTDLAQAKSDIKAAIEAKGVSTTGVPFTEYDSKIAEISGGGGLTPEGTLSSYTVVGDPIAAGDFVTIDGSNVSKRAETHEYELKDIENPPASTINSPLWIYSFLDGNYFYRFIVNNSTGYTLYVQTYTIENDTLVFVSEQSLFSGIGAIFTLREDIVNKKVYLLNYKNSSTYQLVSRVLDYNGVTFTVGSAYTVASTSYPIYYSKYLSMSDQQVPVFEHHYRSGTSSTAIQFTRILSNGSITNISTSIASLSGASSVVYLKENRFLWARYDGVSSLKYFLVQLEGTSTVSHTYNYIVQVEQVPFQTVSSFQEVYYSHDNGDNKIIIFTLNSYPIEITLAEDLNSILLVTTDVKSIVNYEQFANGGYYKNGEYTFTERVDDKYINIIYYSIYQSNFTSYHNQRVLVEVNTSGDYHKPYEIKPSQVTKDGEYLIISEPAHTANTNLLRSSLFRIKNKIGDISGIAASAGESGESINVYSPEVI